MGWLESLGNRELTNEMLTLLVLNCSGLPQQRGASAWVGSGQALQLDNHRVPCSPLCLKHKALLEPGNQGSGSGGANISGGLWVAVLCSGLYVWSLPSKSAQVHPIHCGGGEGMGSWLPSLPMAAIPV